MDSSTKDGVGGAAELEEALRAFAVAVGVDGAEGGGQLAVSWQMSSGNWIPPPDTAAANRSIEEEQRCGTSPPMSSWPGRAM